MQLSKSTLTILMLVILAAFVLPMAYRLTAQVSAQDPAVAVGGGEEEPNLEEKERELHIHRMHLELERAELEASFGRLEMVGRTAQIAENEVTAAAYAVMHVTDLAEPDQAVELLSNALQKTDNQATQRVIRIKLAEIYAHTERPDEALGQFKSLITGE